MSAELTAVEWRAEADDARALAQTDARNAAFHTESARLFDRAATEQEAAA